LGTDHIERSAYHFDEGLPAPGFRLAKKTFDLPSYSREMNPIEEVFRKI
jgi:hypothetical protein